MGETSKAEGNTGSALRKILLERLKQARAFLSKLIPEKTERECNCMLVTGAVVAARVPSRDCPVHGEK
jgi:hypothetical protein